MSFNQSKSDRSESSYSRKPGRSGNSSNQRSSYSSGGGVKGGGSTAPPPPSSINSSSNRRYKNSGSGQPRVNATSPIFESNVSVARAVQNGAHAQPPLPGVAAKPTSSSIPRSPQPIPRPPSKQPPVEPATPIKGDESKGFPLQFGTISPGFMNGMQIPARTSSAPPNLDEQKRDQARHVSSRAVPTMPIPPNTKQQQPRKDASHINRSNTGESHAPSQSKRDVHPQIPSAPNTTTMTQKAHVLPITGMSVPPMPFQPQIPIPYGGPDPQIQSQGITSTSLQMPISLPVGNAAQVQHQMFVQSLPPHHPLLQAMMPQAQNLNFAPQMGHQHQLAPPQLGNMGIGIGSQFTQQQAAKFGAPRKPIKITHPETHKELRLDKRIDPYLDGSRSHPNIPSRTTSVPPNLDEQKRDQGSDSGSKDKVKNTNAKVGKKKRKDILKAKQDVKLAIGDNTKKQSKTEQDDWEVAADGSTPKLKTSDNLDEDGSEITGRNNYSAPLPSPVSSETSGKLEGKGSVSGSKDKKPTLEIYKVKSTNAKVGKKKRKDIHKAADAAAGSSSDLYMAYKGPEEKQDVVVSFENIDSSSSVDVKQAIGDDAEKVIVASEEDEQSKTEPDDWEVAADGSTPELKTSDNLDEGGSEISDRNKYSRDFLLTLAERCTDLPESFRVGSDIAGALMIFPIGMPHLIDSESYPYVRRNIDNRSSARLSQKKKKRNRSSA